MLQRYCALFSIWSQDKTIWNEFTTKKKLREELSCVQERFVDISVCHHRLLHQKQHVHMYTTSSNKSLFIYLFLPQKNNRISLNSINNWRKGNKIETMKCNTRIESKQDLNHTKAQKQQNLFSQSIGMNWMGCLFVCEFTIHHLSTKHSQ